MWTALIPNTLDERFANFERNPVWRADECDKNGERSEIWSMSQFIRIVSREQTTFTLDAIVSRMMSQSASRFPHHCWHNIVKKGFLFK